MIIGADKKRNAVSEVRQYSAEWQESTCAERVNGAHKLCASVKNNSAYKKSQFALLWHFFAATTTVIITAYHQEETSICFLHTATTHSTYMCR